MKNKIKIIVVLFFALMAYSCESELERKVKFEVKATTDKSNTSAEEITVAVGQPVTFNFTGDPDFITFFSGEAGHEYSKRKLFTVPVDEITSNLKFNVKPQYGNIPNTLKVFLSTSFKGLRGNDKQKDSLDIIKNEWKDITDICKLPTKSNKEVGVEVPLNDYLGKKVTIAFHYKPETNTATQPTWIISKLNIENTSKKTKTVTLIGASTMGFQSFDMLSNTPYKNEGGAGVWNLSKLIKKDIIRIQSSPSGVPVNNDWLVSNPILINKRAGDRGVAIKKMSIDLDSYTHTYKKQGTYTVTFLARNENYKSSSEIIKHITIKVK